MRRTTFPILLIWYLLFAGTGVAAQEFIGGPATGSLDSKAILANPSLLSFQRPQVAIGVKSHYSGFNDDSGSGFSQGYFLASLPNIRGSRFGAGVHGHYFNSPVFTRSQLGASFSARLIHRVSIGASGMLYHLGYNSDNFTHFDFDDPVFQNGYSRNTFNSTIGVYARPGAGLELASGARNLNRPDISLAGDGVREPLELFGAISYRYDIFKGTVELVNGSYDLDTRVHLEAFSTLGYYARMGTNMRFDRGYIEAQMHVYGGVSVNYQFELPFNDVLSETYGSHMFSLVYEFNRVAPLPQSMTARVSIPEIRRTRTAAELPATVALTSTTDHMEYTEVNLTRVVDETTITAEDLQHLTAYDVGSIEHQQDYLRMGYHGRRPHTPPLPTTIQPEPVITDHYRQTLDFIRDHIIHRNNQMELVIEDGTQIRAAGLRTRFLDQSGRDIPVSVTYRSDELDSVRYNTPLSPENLEDQQAIVLIPEMARIKPVKAVNIPIEASEWALRVFAGNGRQVVEIRESSGLPEVIEWDWRLENGSIIDPGLYTYNLTWRDSEGSWHETRSRYLYVQKITRNITLDITKDLEKIHSDPDKIELILKNK